jgi:hypothetical protein
MVKFKHLAAIAISSTVIANPVLAQPVILEPGAYTKNYPNAGLGIGSRRSSRAAISTRSAQTTVWPAPVGHRQPRLADVPSSAAAPNALLSLDQEDASVDRKIGGICRGC